MTVTVGGTTPAVSSGNPKCLAISHVLPYLRLRPPVISFVDKYASSAFVCYTFPGGSLDSVGGV